MELSKSARSWCVKASLVHRWDSQAIRVSLSRFWNLIVGTNEEATLEMDHNFESVGCQ